MWAARTSTTETQAVLKQAAAKISKVRAGVLMTYNDEQDHGYKMTASQGAVAMAPR